MARTFEIAIELAGKINSSLGRAFMTSSERLQEMNRHISSLRADIRKLEQDQKKGAISTEEYAAAHAKLTAQLQKAEQAQKRFAKAVNLQQRVTDFRVRMRGNLLDAAAMATTIGAPVYAAMQFESAMADVRKVVDFETPQQFKAMGKDILNLSKRIPMAANGLAQIVAAGGQAGIARDELLSYAEAAAKMGVAFDITAEEAGQTMAEWRSAFKMNQEQVNTLADQINYLGNTTAASAPKIAEVVRRIGPLGEVGGAAAAQIAALGATMVSAGIQEEIAATGIKNLILGLTAGEAATKSQAEAFQALGLDAKNMAVMMQKDAQGAILKVLQALQKLPKHRQAAVLSDLFGKESIGAIAPLLTNLDALKKNFERVGDATQYAGSMQKEFESRSETSENRLQLLRNQATALGTSIGNILLPPLNKLMGAAANLAEKVQGFTERYPNLTQAIVIGTAAVLGLSIAFTALGYAAGILISPFSTIYMLATKFGIISRVGAIATKAWAAAQWLWNAALSANPIGLVIIAVSGLITAGYLLVKNWEKIKTFFINFWKDPLAALDSFIQKIYEKVGKVVRWIGSKLGFGGGDVASSGGVGGFRAIEGHATGGIYDKPHIAWFAERGPEAAIPLDGSSRSLSLWAQAGEMLGVSPAGSTIQITFAPVIHAPGGDPGVIRQVLKDSRDDFMERFQAMLRQERRLSYE
ncbi:hypothetical protein E306M_09410 [Moorella sp. E306M]|nr:phage tail tape measure protein [Moorella sp. E306M]GEA17738.1 hypothetical protein E306M_08720 [Moorella sp. E306M]GEA17807.1 hypothetical protein E306M_09410 [Moorella sp. E306M]